MDGDVRSASAMALARTAILTLQREDFLRFITTNPQGAAAVFRSLAALIRRQNAQLYGEFFGS
jgi:CRP-like cAMP-binding protein